MSRIIKTAWGEEDNSANVKNAYHNIKGDDVIVNLQGQIIGIASHIKARCTVTSPGSVHLFNDKKENVWVTGDVIDMGDNTWVITNSTIVK